MKRIFKYKLPRDGETVIIPANVVKWLDIQEQNGWPHIWAVVEDNGMHEHEYEFAAWGTGWDCPDEFDRYEYMGTAQDGFGYVWHYFMRDRAVMGGEPDFWMINRNVPRADCDSVTLTEDYPHAYL